MEGSLITGGEIQPMLPFPESMTAHVFIALTTLILLASCASQDAHDLSFPKPKADAYCLIDAQSGLLLSGRHITQRRPVASTQKLLTALVAAKAGEADRFVTVTTSDINVTGSRLGLLAGDQLTRGDLLKALLLESANDAALALARDVAGSSEAFAERMNTTASELGATKSKFVNPHGLTAIGQRSCAEDMARIARAAFQQSEVRRIVAALTLTIRVNRQPRTLRNANELLERLPGCTGMKTGFTPGAGVCLVSSMRSGEREVILVQLGSTKEHIYNDAALLMKQGLKRNPSVKEPSKQVP